MKLTKGQLRRLIKEQIAEVGGLGRAMGEEGYSSLEQGVEALIRNWDPRTPEGQRYLEELEALNAQFQGGEDPEYVTLRDPDRLGQQLAFEDGGPPLSKIKDVAGVEHDRAELKKALPPGDFKAISRPGTKYFVRKNKQGKITGIGPD